jgi:tRNA threonylcarbamoyladenosine biosynthesis protein TsaB
MTADSGASTASPTVLALDTSTTRISAAVQAGTHTGQRSLEAGRDTGAMLPSVVADVLRDAECTTADIDAVAVGVGPAPYTSLRVGVMFARALAAALQVPVIGACSLDITARGVTAAEQFAVLADARRKEVYWAIYGPDGQRVQGPQVAARAWVQDSIDVPMVGENPRADVLAEWVVSQWEAGPPQLTEVSGHWVAARADAAEVQIPHTLLTATPLYLRRPDVAEPVASTT